jgi:hypothetical protein
VLNLAQKNPNVRLLGIYRHPHQLHKMRNSLAILSILLLSYTLHLIISTISSSDDDGYKSASNSPEDALQAGDDDDSSETDFELGSPEDEVKLCVRCRREPYATSNYICIKCDGDRKQPDWARHHFPSSDRKEDSDEVFQMLTKVEENGVQASLLNSEDEREQNGVLSKG